MNYNKLHLMLSLPLPKMPPSKTHHHFLLLLLTVIATAVNAVTFKEAPKFYNSPTCGPTHPFICSFLEPGKGFHHSERIDERAAEEAVHVAMTLDATYLRGSVAVILSVLQHSSCPENIFFHFITIDVSLSSTIAATFPYLNFKVYPFHDGAVYGLISTSIRSALDCSLNYARNYLADILPSCVRRVVYLDSDLILVDDIAKLASTPLVNGAVLAAPEYCNANFSFYFTPSFWANPLLSMTFEGRNACYFNTGVMVIDLQRWRSGDYTRKIVEWMELQKRMRIYELGSLPPFLLVFAGNIAPVDHRWNQHGLGGDNYRGLCRDLHSGPVSLLHWSGKGKPWVRLDSNRPCPLDALWAPYDLLQTSLAIES